MLEPVKWEEGLIDNQVEKPQVGCSEVVAEVDRDSVVEPKIQQAFVGILEQCWPGRLVELRF